MTRLRVAAGQINPVVGDLDGNVDRMRAALEAAEADAADLIVFPELAVTGYPPEDLLLKPTFVVDNRRALDKLAGLTDRCVAIVGFADRDGGRLHNAAAVCAGGEVVGVYRKHRLPNYAVFDEQRYFAEGEEGFVLFGVRGVPVGVSICEDAWSPGGPVAVQAAGGAALVVNLNASPYHRGRVAERERMLADRADEASVPMLYVNLVGGQDELVFDGASMFVDGSGRVVARAPQYVEDLLIVDVTIDDARGAPELPLIVASLAGPDPTPATVHDPSPLLSPCREVYEALVVGTRDYVRKNGFASVLVGLSGGVDSSLVAAVAVDALGADNVHGVLMPSRYSSDHSVTDAERLCRNLGIEHRTIAIEPAHTSLLGMLEHSFAKTDEGLSEENIQPRIRGLVLMALSNKFGWMVLTTGNKSEMSVGYATLYGDMAGGFAVIKDVPKSLVYDLCRDLNVRADREIVPDHVLTKPPSAELRPDQVDTDSLPPYEVLDPILEAYVEDDRTRADLEAMGFDPQLVHRITRLVDLSEYKRRQSPPGPRITTKAFGKDRRLPIVNAYRS
jgi:NAD+ synthase (glutamine-hydrolysing)